MKIDRTGMRYGKLIVIGWSHSQYRSPRHGSYQFWFCKCDCGKSTVVLGNNLVKKNTTSCGCNSSRLTVGDRLTTHGMSKTQTYKSWSAMKDRCYQKSHKEYQRYGARGITVCKRWRDSFEYFFKDMGERPPGHSIDRININKGYSPSNCIWSTSEQQANNRRNNRIIKFESEVMTLARWAKKTGIKYGTLHSRLKMGWSVDRALGYSK